MYWGIIHRNILAELLKIFILALIALTGMILMAGIISEAMKNGFGPLQILTIIPLLLPSLLPFTVPTATLFTTCIVYGRLAADNEILALKAAGIHIRHVVWPALLLGLATSAATMFFYIDVIPATGSLMRNSAFGEPEELLYAILRKDLQIKHPRIDWEINVMTMQGRKLQNVIFKRRKVDAKGIAFDVIARAKEAELRYDPMHKKILVHMRRCNCDFGDGRKGDFDQQILEVDVPDDFFGARVKFRAMDMTWSELHKHLDKTHAELEKIDDEIAITSAELNLGKGDVNTGNHLKSLFNAQENKQNQVYSIESEFQWRPALALGCLCFALVGCPVGIWFSKSDYLSAFITCFLPIVIIYYPLMFCMFNMSRAGKIPPWSGIYNADSIMLCAGWILFRRLARN